MEVPMQAPTAACGDEDVQALQAVAQRGSFKPMITITITITSALSLCLQSR
jgi:hypothetical protein